MKKLLILLTIFTLALGSCATKVSTSYDQQTDFSRYKTFCWLQGCEFSFTGPAYLNDTLIIGRLQRVIIKEMEKKGMTYDAGSADLLLDFHVTVESKETQVYRFEQERYNLLDPADTPDVYYYLEGTVIIDMVDRETGEMVWRSEAQRYLELNPDLSEANLQKGISIVLRGFPPKMRKVD